MFIRFFLIFFSFVVPAFAQSTFDEAEFAKADIENGKKLFKKCAACHQIGEGAKNRVGPILTGVVGRPVATIENYKYGKDIKTFAETGEVWNKQNIFSWLENPRDFLRTKLENQKAKTKMTLRLKKANERYDIIAYLESVKE